MLICRGHCTSASTFNLVGGTVMLIATLCCVKVRVAVRMRARIGPANLRSPVFSVRRQ